MSEKKGEEFARKNSIVMLIGPELAGMGIDTASVVKPSKLLLLH